MITRRELNRAIFEGRARQVLWQPRLETWYRFHHEHGTLPDRFKGMERFEVYDALRCSVRYGASKGWDLCYDSDAVVYFVEDPDPEHHVEGIRFPEGELRTVHQNVWENGDLVNRRIVKYPVETVEELRMLTALVNRRRFRCDFDRFRAFEKRLGSRAEPTAYTSSDGFTDLIKFWTGLEAAFFLLADHPEEVDAYVEACNRADDRLFDAVLQLPVRLYNLTDHTTNEFTPPPILERYCLPRWRKISRRVADAGRFVHSHWDGHSRLILPYLRPSGLHGVEALTPEPMGDMTLEMIRAAVPEHMVVLDLLPAIMFLPNYPLNDLLDFARRVIDLFAPRLILGVSDEISHVCEIERIEAISELVDKTCGLAA